MRHRARRWREQAHYALICPAVHSGGSRRGLQATRCPPFCLPGHPCEKRRAGSELGMRAKYMVLGGKQLKGRQSRSYWKLKGSGQSRQHPPPYLWLAEFGLWSCLQGPVCRLHLTNYQKPPCRVNPVAPSACNLGCQPAPRQRQRPATGAHSCALMMCLACSWRQNATNRHSAECCFCCDFIHTRQAQVMFGGDRCVSGLAALVRGSCARHLPPAPPGPSSARPQTVPAPSLALEI